MKFNDIIYWNNKSYGNAVKIKRSTLIAAAIFACVITPCTNWLIPFVGRAIKSDIIVRY